VKYDHLHDKTPNYFKRFSNSHENGSTNSVTKFKAAERAQKASNLLAETAAKRIKISCNLRYINSPTL
jgi:hypothetical protein